MSAVRCPDPAGGSDENTGKPAWTAEDFAAMGTFMEALNSELAESGELVETRGLLAPVHTRRLQLQGGVPVVTVSPACPAAEHVAATAVADVRPIVESRDDLNV